MRRAGFRPPAGGKIFGRFGDAMGEFALLGQALGVCEAGTRQQPIGVTAAFFPGIGVALQVLGVEEVLTFFVQPAGEVVPLAQQAFQCDLDHDMAAAGVFDHESLCDKVVDQRPALRRQIVVTGHPAHRLVVVWIDRDELGDECGPQQPQLVLSVAWPGQKNLLYLVFDDITHAPIAS